MSSVDVIVPCYRYGHFLKECVESVLAQSGPSVRVLVIDDASPDNTAEVATELTHDDTRVTFVRHPKNRGHIATYNEGIDWASAEYLLLLSADDYLLPGCLKRAVDFMDHHPEVGLTFGPAINLERNGGTRILATFSCNRVLSGPEFIKLSGPTSLITTSSAVVRTVLQKRIGGYCPELPHAGDMEMWLRFAAHASVGYIAEPQSVYRFHDCNMSSSYYNGILPALKQQELALDRFFSRYGANVPHGNALHQRARRLLACAAIGKASQPLAEGLQDVSNELASFARKTCPSVVRSWAWCKFQFKLTLGSRLYRSYRALKCWASFTD